ncbi:MAG: ATP-dependent DNA helicase AdnB [Chloroflexota bacterium]
MTVTDDSALTTGLPNPEQETVILHDHGPLRIMAGAGTGKTHTLTARVVRLIRDGQAHPEEILALAFGNKAAAHLRAGIGKACLQIGVPPDAEPVCVLTYNSFGGSVISEWGGTIGLPPFPPLLSKAERWLLLWDCMPRIDFRSINLMHLRSTRGSPMDPILRLGSRLADELATPHQLLEFLEGGGVENEETRDTLLDYARALIVFEGEKRVRGVIDYDDQITIAVRALDGDDVRKAYRDRFRFVLVDEYQDTNYAQSAMVGLLTQNFPQRNVCVVGDIRQAIFAFRGAASDNLKRFPDDFPGSASYSLRSNYRSTENILTAANAVWADEPGDQRDDLVSANGRQGPQVVSCACEDRESEWEWISRIIAAEHEAGTAYREMAVLVRKNDKKGEVWRGLLDRGIPAISTGGASLYKTPEVREILSYLRSLARTSDNISLAHVASSDSFGLDEATLYDIIGPLPRGRSLFDVMQERAADPSTPNDLRLFLATFSRLLSESATQSTARVVERIIGLRRGAYNDAQRANVNRFHGIAQDFASGRVRGASVSAFVTYINLLLSAPPDEEEATDVSDEDAVQVLTVHAAKGLEKRVIFVATASQQDFKTANRSDSLPLELRHPAAGMPKSSEFSSSGRYLSALKAWEKSEHELEEQRILYVALTRARDRLYISWHRLPSHYGKDRRPLEHLKHVLPLTVSRTFDRVDWVDLNNRPAVVDGSDFARRFAREQSNLWAGWTQDEFQADGESLAERLAIGWEGYREELGPATEGEDMLAVGMRQWASEKHRVEGLLRRCLMPAVRPSDVDTREVIDVPTTLSYSMLATYRECSRKAYLRFLVGFPGDPSPQSTGPGTSFHAAVETAAAALQGGGEPTFDDLVSSFTEAAAEAHGIRHYALTEEDRTMLHAFWDGPDREATPLFVEAEFYWRVGPGYLHGYIDRIQQCPDGTMELIDFKTSRTAQTELAARQNLQLIIYALATREIHKIELDRLTLVYPRLSKRVSVSFSDEELRVARMGIVDLMERARTARYDDYNTHHCPVCEYRLICPAAALQYVPNKASFTG